MDNTPGAGAPWGVTIWQYRDFWDVPRMFVVEVGGDTLLFDCPFDEDRDDYAPAYTVYQMPPLSDADLAGPWAGLPTRALRRLGTIDVPTVSFGSGGRSEVAWRAIEPFLAQVNRGSLRNGPAGTTRPQGAPAVADPSVE
jgi:hypothetical protein